MRPSSIGFIGLGNMGFEMGKLLLSQGYHVLGYDVNEEIRDRFCIHGGSIGTLKKIISSTSCIILMLPNSNIVNKVIHDLIDCRNTNDQGKQLTVIDMSSSFPIDTKKNGVLLNEVGIELMDAPVSGGVKKARTGELTIMVGGKKETLEQHEPILKVLGKNIFFIGALGSGHTVKAINNFLSATHLLATSEAVRLLTDMNIDPNVAVQTFSQSSGRSFSTEYKFPEFILPATYNSGFSLDLLAKDVRLTKEISEHLGKTSPLISLITDTYQHAKDDLEDGVDHTEIFKFVSTYMK